MIRLEPTIKIGYLIKKIIYVCELVGGDNNYY